MRARDESEGVGRGMRSHSMELIPSSSSCCSREITDITRKIASLSNDFRWDEAKGTGSRDLIQNWTKMDYRSL
jgi:hypothetical protein